MKTTILMVLSVIVMVTLMSGCGPSAKLSVGERQQLIYDMEKETLMRSICKKRLVTVRIITM